MGFAEFAIFICDDAHISRPRFEYIDWLLLSLFLFVLGLGILCFGVGVVIGGTAITHI